MTELGDVRVRGQAFSADIRAGRILRLFERAPRVTFFHVRDAVGGMYGSHRREWLARTKVEFSQRNGMRAENLSSSEAPTGSKRRSFFYRVYPKNKKVPKGQRPNLDDIRAEAFTSSKVALGLEQGGTHKAKRSRWIAIPIGVTLDTLGRPKSRWVTPRAYRKAGANNELVSLRLGTKYPVLYQVKSGRKAAGTSGAVTLLRDRPTGRSRTSRRVLLPAYQLVPAVRRRPLLRYMATWEALESDRGRRLSRAIDRIMQEVERDQPS